ADLAGDPVFEARFLNEARRAASISHPNVVTVLDFGTDGPGPYLVMELVEGGDLAKLITAKGSLPSRRAAGIAADVASALQAAHAHGIVHRDVKPGNILLGADGQPRVADFGIARATDEESLTGTGTSLGSVDYFSPEQARGEAATSASDIYSLGVVLYEMLTGRRPFTGDTAYAVAVARIEAPPPDPRAIKRSIPVALGAMVQRAMAVDPSGRFASAADLGAALREWLDAHPAPKAAAIAAPARRPRGARAAALAGAALAAAPVQPPAPSPSSIEETRAVPIRAASPPPVVSVASAAGAPANSQPVPIADARARRRRSPRLVAAAAALLLAVIGFAGGRMIAGPEDGLGGVVVGEPSGGVLASTPEPTRRPTPDATPSSTAQPTVEPTATPAPVAAAPPAPAAPVVTPAQPVMVAMAVSPDETVFNWYSQVESGEFDAAYSLWSDRMKANFPREGNLDNRWRDTADIAFSQLYVVSQTQTTATVQVDFVETRDDGSSRRFTGWWELVRSGDGWLLDQPHF
ncbi:MAG: serine/threonine-protein kinase, partial [Candidatus Limnocylindria bacterium]